MMKEINQYVGEKPATDAEVQKVIEQNTLSLPGQWETNGRVANSLINMVSDDLADNYYDKAPFRFEGTLKRLHFQNLPAEEGAVPVVPDD